METLQKIKNTMDFQAILINFNKKPYKIQDYVISSVIIDCFNFQYFLLRKKKVYVPVYTEPDNHPIVAEMFC